MPYPSTALAARQLAVIALVAVGALTAWRAETCPGQPGWLTSVTSPSCPKHR
jgi:hypothetical protein